jgi:hypothetical protein
MNFRQDVFFWIQTHRSKNAAIRKIQTSRMLHARAAPQRRGRKVLTCLCPCFRLRARRAIKTDLVQCDLAGAEHPPLRWSVSALVEQLVNCVKVKRERETNDRNQSLYFIDVDCYLFISINSSEVNEKLWLIHSFLCLGSTCRGGNIKLVNLDRWMYV